MEEVARIPAQRACVRMKDGNVVLFTPGQASYLLYRVASGDMLQRRLRAPIVNIDFLARTLVVFFEHCHVEYSIWEGAKLTTYVVERVVGKLVVDSDFAYLLRERELLPNLYGQMPSPVRVDWARVVDHAYLCTCSANVLSIHVGRAQVYSVAVANSERVDVSIRRGKVYVLDGDRIRGHDLNLYLDELADFAPTRFTNIENEVLLYDGARQLLRLYQKNLKNLLFECRATDYCYDPSTQLLAVLQDGTHVAVYAHKNIYTQPFRLVHGSTVYTENEDEFDESDSAHVDFIAATEESQSSAETSTAVSVCGEQGPHFVHV
ncbi:hypothetical protein PAPHI01_1364 [Pancytospora philotis]|nr:hypothetical protein PAPHI01_1364 [Pancytospora philotis]